MKSLKVNNTENWRLSKIEEEDQDKMTTSVTSSSSSSTNHSSPQKYGSLPHNSKHSSSLRANDNSCTTPAESRSLNQSNVDDNGYEKVPQSKEEWEKFRCGAAKVEEAVKTIKSKYDSLERARMSKQIAPLQASASTNNTSIPQNNINLNNVHQSINPSAIESLNSSVHNLNQCLLSSLQQPFSADLTNINYSDPLMDSISNQILNVNWSDLPFPPPPDVSHLAAPQPIDSFQRQNQSVQLRNIKLPETQQKQVNGEVDSRNKNVLPCQHLTEHDLLQVETFYKGHKTEVYVSTCMAAVFLSSSGPNSNAPQVQQKHLQQMHGSPRLSKSSELPTESHNCSDNYKWTFHKEGIPVFVLDSGESRRQKRLHIVLAEKGTAFPMWRDVLTHLSQYRIGQEPNFHVMNSSKDHSKHVGFRFYDTMSAHLFYSQYVRITNDGEDDVLDLSNNRKKLKSKTGSRHSPKSANKLTFKKSDISQPCCFTHITKIEGADMSNRNPN